jgi:hypothetical protein
MTAKETKEKARLSCSRSHRFEPFLLCLLHVAATGVSAAHMGLLRYRCRARMLKASKTILFFPRLSFSSTPLRCFYSQTIQHDAENSRSVTLTKRKTINCEREKRVRRTEKTTTKETRTADEEDSKGRGATEEVEAKEGKGGSKASVRKREKKRKKKLTHQHTCCASLPDSDPSRRRRDPCSWGCRHRVRQGRREREPRKGSGKEWRSMSSASSANEVDEEPFDRVQVFRMLSEVTPVPPLLLQLPLFHPLFLITSRNLASSPRPHNSAGRLPVPQRYSSESPHSVDTREGVLPSRLSS